MEIYTKLYLTYAAVAVTSLAIASAFTDYESTKIFNWVFAVGVYIPTALVIVTGLVQVWSL